MALKIKFPMDKKGADILLLHNAGEYMAWPENPIAFAILFEEAGLNWTLSSEIAGYDNVNYGIWYDDFQSKQLATDIREPDEVAASPLSAKGT